MKLEDKKYLAEWMGWEVQHFASNTKYEHLVIYGETEVVEGGSGLFESNHWNPDDNHKQFAEVWNKLTHKQRYTFYCEVSGSYILDAVLNNLPGVLDIVLKVIKEK